MQNVGDMTREFLSCGEMFCENVFQQEHKWRNLETSSSKAKGFRQGSDSTTIWDNWPLGSHRCLLRYRSFHDILWCRFCKFACNHRRIPWDHHSNKGRKTEVCGRPETAIQCKARLHLCCYSFFWLYEVVHRRSMTHLLMLSSQQQNDVLMQ